MAPDGAAGERRRTPAGGNGGVSVADFEELDEAYRSYLAAHPEPPGGSLLAQTIATGPVRRSLLPVVPLAGGWRVLDLGTGFGPLAFELARLAGVEVVGVDLDEAVLEAATSLGGSLEGFVSPGASVRFEQADVAALPFDDGSFELVTARLLFQHLAAPAAAAGELARVLRPGGFAFVFDVDDGLGASYPPTEGPLAVLEDAYAAWQASYGGDRQVGRKLSSLLVAAGMSIEAVVVVPQAEHRRSEPGDLARTVTAARLRAARSEMAAAGLLDAAEADRLLESYEAAPPHEQCRIECQVAVVARRPGPTG